MLLYYAYYALVRSHKNCGILLWGNNADVRNVFTPRNKAIRIVKVRELRDHNQNIF